MYSNAMKFHRLNGRMYTWAQAHTWNGAMFVLNHEDQRVIGIVEEHPSGCVWSVRIVSAGLVQVQEGAESDVVGAQCAVDRAVDEFLSVGWLLTC